MSVVITCYNEQVYIAEAIESVLRQTAFEAVKEMVVVNDGSSDASEEVICRYADSHPKIQYIYQDNEGLPAARNTGIRSSTGTYVALLDGDDVWKENKLERQLAFVKRHPDVGIVYSDSYLFNRGQSDAEQRRVYARHYDYKEDNTLKRLFVKGGPIVPSTTLIKRGCFQQVGLFDPCLLRAQDSDMWLRIARDYPIHHLKEPLIWRRVHEESLGSNYEKKVEYLLRVSEKATARCPELRPLKKKRTAMIYSALARHLLRDAERKKAVGVVLQALSYDPTSLKSYMTLCFALLPLPQAALQELRKWARYGLRESTTSSVVAEFMSSIRAR